MSEKEVKNRGAWEDCRRCGAAILITHPEADPEVVAGQVSATRDTVPREWQDVVEQFGRCVTDMFEQLERGNWRDDHGHDIRMNAAMISLKNPVKEAIRLRAMLAAAPAEATRPQYSGKCADLHKYIAMPNKASPAESAEPVDWFQRYIDLYESARDVAEAMLVGDDSPEILRLAQWVIDSDAAPKATPPQAEAAETPDYGNPVMLKAGDIRPSQPLVNALGQPIAVEAAEPVAIDETPLTDEFEADEENGFKRGWKRWPEFARGLERRMRQLHAKLYPNPKAAPPEDREPTEKRIRYCKAREVSEINRDRVRASGLANIGDAVLVWVNEGDLCMIGTEVDRTKLPSASVLDMNSRPISEKP